MTIVGIFMGLGALSLLAIWKLLASQQPSDFCPFCGFTTEFCQCED